MTSDKQTDYICMLRTQAFKFRVFTYTVKTSLYILISKNQVLQILPAPCILLLFNSYTTINTPYN